MSADPLHALVLALAERVCVQSELLSRAAEARMLYETEIFHGRGTRTLRPVRSAFVLYAERQFFYTTRRAVAVFAEEIDAIVLKSLLQEHAEKWAAEVKGRAWSKFDFPHPDMKDYRGENLFWIEEVPAGNHKLVPRAKYRRLHGR